MRVFYLISVYLMISHTQDSVSADVSAGNSLEVGFTDVAQLGREPANQVNTASLGVMQQNSLTTIEIFPIHGRLQTQNIITIYRSLRTLFRHIRFPCKLVLFFFSIQIRIKHVLNYIYTPAKFQYSNDFVIVVLVSV